MLALIPQAVGGGAPHIVAVLVVYPADVAGAVKACFRGGTAPDVGRAYILLGFLVDGSKLAVGQGFCRNLIIKVNALATTTNSLVSNAIGAGGINYVMPLINKIGRFSFLIMLGLVIITALFPQALLSVYTNETALINESVSSVYVICVAMLIASVANVVFNGISGTGNTQAALMLEAITIAIYGSYIIFIGMWVKAPIEWCFTIEILYYTLLLATSYIYFKKAKWQNKKI